MKKGKLFKFPNILLYCTNFELVEIKYLILSRNSFPFLSFFLSLPFECFASYSCKFWTFFCLLFLSSQCKIMLLCGSILNSPLEEILYFYSLIDIHRSTLQHLLRAVIKFMSHNLDKISVDNHFIFKFQNNFA